jgi:ATP-binding cassette subfamily F protein uup
LERVCDRFVGLLGDKKVRDLPRGVDEYLEQRAVALSAVTSTTKEKKSSNAAEQRQLKKDLVRLERQIEKCNAAIATLTAEQETAAFDADRLVVIASELAVLGTEAAKLEEEWLQVTLSLEG